MLLWRHSHSVATCDLAALPFVVVVTSTSPSLSCPHPVEHVLASFYVILCAPLLPHFRLLVNSPKYRLCRGRQTVTEANILCRPVCRWQWAVLALVLGLVSFPFFLSRCLLLTVVSGQRRTCAMQLYSAFTNLNLHQFSLFTTFRSR